MKGEFQSPSAPIRSTPASSHGSLPAPHPGSKHLPAVISRRLWPMQRRLKRMKITCIIVRFRLHRRASERWSNGGSAAGYLDLYSKGKIRLFFPVFCGKQSPLILPAVPIRFLTRRRTCISTRHHRDEAAVKVSLPHQSATMYLHSFHRYAINFWNGSMTFLLADPLDTTDETTWRPDEIESEQQTVINWCDVVYSVWNYKGRTAISIILSPARIYFSLPPQSSAYRSLPLISTIVFTVLPLHLFPASTVQFCPTFCSFPFLFQNPPFCCSTNKTIDFIWFYIFAIFNNFSK